VEWELLTFAVHLSLPLVFCSVHVAQLLFFCVIFCGSLFVFLSFFSGPLYCLSFKLFLDFQGRSLLSLMSISYFPLIT
jgi:hypothetical protein